MTTVKTKPAPNVEGKATPQEYLEVAAYYHWRARGCPLGDPLVDWLAAEEEWRFGKAHSRNRWRWFRPDSLPFLGRIFPF